MDRTVAPGAADSGSTPLRNVKLEVEMYNLIDGKKISESILADLKEKINILNVTGKNRVLTDIFVGEDPSSLVYVNSKIKKFHEIGIKFNLIKLKSDVSESELINTIKSLNENIDTNAIFLELPLPKSINELNVINSISPKKDVDGFSNMSLGSLFKGTDGFYPCTAEGILQLLKSSNIQISGKNAVVVGRSNIVGKPIAMLLLKEDATVTICHSKTKNLKDICKTADILIVAIGSPKFIDESYIKPGAVVIDAGINRIKVDDKNIICGDVDFEKVAPLTSYITPVPGGVGPMTITMLIKHCVDTINYE